MPERLGSPSHVVASVAALLRASLMTGLQYRSDFLFDSLTGLVRSIATAAPLLVVYGHTDAVAGWALPDAALVMALFLGLSAVVGGVVEPNLGAVVEGVREGSLDLVLMKPADAQLLVSLRTVAPARMWDGLAAVGLGGWALTQLPAPSPLDVLIALVLVCAGLASMYALWLLAICTSFFFVRVDNLRHLIDAVTGAGRWPITVFSGWVRWALTIVVPIGIITSFPAMALRGAWDLSLVGVALGTASVFLVLSRRAWVWSLAAYTSASS